MAVTCPAARVAVGVVPAATPVAVTGVVVRLEDGVNACVAVGGRVGGRVGESTETTAVLVTGADASVG